MINAFLYLLCVHKLFKYIGIGHVSLYLNIGIGIRFKFCVSVHHYLQWSLVITNQITTIHKSSDVH